MREVIDAYWMGRVAFCLDKKITDNPFEENNKHFAEWDCGFQYEERSFGYKLERQARDQ